MCLVWVKLPPGRPGVLTAEGLQGLQRVQGGAGRCWGVGGRGEAGGARFRSCGLASAPPGLISGVRVAARLLGKLFIRTGSWCARPKLDPVCYRRL